jgi:hypothetical protein
VNSSVAFNTFTMLWVHHLYFIPKYFFSDKWKPEPFEQLLSIPFPRPWQFFLFLWVLSILDISYKWNHTTCCLLCWLLSLRTMFLRSIHFAACKEILLHSFLWLDNIPFCIYIYIYTHTHTHIYITIVYPFNCLFMGINVLLLCSVFNNE